ncbi:MAG: PilZ domain-containing protein [Thermoanaerobaculia bacterium]
MNSSDERRKGSPVRVQRPLDATYSADSPPMQARIEDISERGCFIDAQHPPPTGTQIRIRFSLPSDPSGEPVECDALVAWMQPNVGMGVQFLDLPQETSDRIRFFIASVYFGHDNGP